MIRKHLRKYSPIVRLILLLCCSQISKGQCLVNSLNITTGYNPSTGGYTVPTTLDPKWLLDAVSPAMQADIDAGGWIKGPYIVSTHPLWTTCDNCRWLNCVNATSIANTTDPGLRWMLFKRSFRLCCEADVCISINMAYDDDIQFMKIDNGPDFFVDDGNSPGDNCHLQNYCTHLTAGVHTLWVRVDNDGGLASNGNGLCLSGTITSGTGIAGGAIVTLGNSLVSEAAVCSTYNCELPPISGDHDMCVGDCVTFTDATAGGTWSGTSSVATVNSSTGVVCATFPGIATVSYSLGCLSTTYVVTVAPIPTVNPVPPICVGDALVLTASPPGGIWISTIPSVGTIDLTTGSLTGISGPGTTTISYTNSGCTNTTLVTVNPIPDPIVYDPTLCVGFSVTLGDPSPGGGTWSTSSTDIAIVAASGSVTVTCLSAPVSGSGTAWITYTLPTGCKRSYSFSIYSNTPRIDGDLRICVNDPPSTLTHPFSGTWDINPTTVATISSTGVVTPVTSGTATVTFTPTHCNSVTAVFTVDPLPTITGATSVCHTFTTALTAIPAGGDWISGSPAIASVDPVTGVVTGETPGTATIIYISPDPAHCINFHTITVNPLPAPIDTAHTVCQGWGTVFGDPTLGGAWTSSDPTIAYPVSPPVGGYFGATPGVVTVTYTMPTGCYVTSTLTVDATPTPITGPSSVCVHSTITLASTPTGGVWSGGVAYPSWPGYIAACYCVWDPATSTYLSSSTPGEVTGMVAGTPTMKYSLPNGCYVTTTINVLPLPDPVSGPTSVCMGNTATFTSDPPGGTWSSTNTAVGTIDAAGVFTPGSVGTTTIVYTLGTGCAISKIVSVNPLPAPIGSPGPLVCVGSTTTLTNTSLGGAWSTADVTYATVNSITGVVTGLAVGTPAFTYTLPTGCSRTFIVTVDDLPVVAAISGPGLVCVGSMITLGSTPTGGAWSSSAPGIGSVDASTGVVTGIGDGTTTISYTVTNTCGSTTVTTNILVGPPIVLPITGATGLCVAHTTTMANALAGGTWSCSPAAVATVNTSTGVVTGMGLGTATITYTVSNICGTTIVTANITVSDMTAFITPDFIGACTIAADPPYLSSGSPCIFTCANSPMTYNANVPPGSTHTWTVTGGTIVAEVGNTITVNWTSPGATGSIVLHVEMGDCTADATLCVKVKESPAAKFTASASSICLGGSVSFTDASTWTEPETPVTSWVWDFGDGAVSALQNPTHTYTTAGTYTVTLTAGNLCGCTAQMTMTIVVNPLSGPDIQCPSIVCEDHTVTYWTSETCGTYNWEVTGGTIVSGAGTSTITVTWDSPDATGYGSVSLIATCAPCPATTTIKVPVILSNPAIDGPSTICAGAQYKYKLPLWPSTQYHWDCLLTSGADGIPSGTPDDDNVVTVLYNTPGVYRIRCTYQNKLGLCGGDVFKTIIVRPAETISGPTDICLGVSPTYTLSGSAIGLWDLVYQTGVVEASSSGYTGSFLTSPSFSGDYTVKAMGSFCADPLTVHISSFVPAIDALTGPDVICLGHYYTYKAGLPVAGTVYEWSIVGGIMTPSASGEVTVQWTSPGAKELRVHRKSLTAPYCIGDDYYLPVTDDPYSAAISGPSTSCPNSYSNFTNPYTGGDEYIWTIIPETDGSVISGNHTPSVTVQWNNVPDGTPVQVKLEVTKCDVTVTDIVTVILTHIPLTVSAPDTLCPHEAFTITATPGDSMYVWNFGDGTPIQTTSANTLTHVFGGNGGVVRTVKVTPILGSAYTMGCQPTGIVMHNIYVRPAPAAGIGETPSTPCPNSVLTASFAVTTPAVSYQWYYNGTPMGASGTLLPGTTTTAYTVTATGDYWIVGTAANGCTGSTNIVNVNCDGIDPGVEPCGDMPTVFTPTVTCNAVSLAGVGFWGSSNPRWFWEEVPSTSSGFLNSTPPVYSTAAVATYTAPGIYHYRFSVDGVGGCTSTEYVTATVPAVVEFNYKITCTPGNIITVDLEDKTALLPGYSITSRTWTDVTGAPIGLGTASTASFTATPGGSYTIREEVLYTGATVPCPIDHTILVPALPVATFTLATTPTCEGIPVSFTPVLSPDIVSYYWDFNDGSSSLLTNTERTYTWSSLLVSNPNVRTPTLSVTNAMGCTGTSSSPIDVYRNLVNGSVLGVNICSNSLPTTLTFNSFVSLTGPISYEWQRDGYIGSLGSSNPLPGVSESGYYRVVVKDGHGCQNLLPSPTSAQVNVIQVPPPTISGRTHYCDGETIELSALDCPGASYAWTLNGGPLATTPSITDVQSVNPTPYNYQFTVSVMDVISSMTCTETSPVVPVTVEALPAAPVITGPVPVDCSNYHLQFTATASQPGTFVWNNGTAAAINDVYEGGPFEVWFTSLGGCSSSATVDAPLSPQHYFQYFPSGCYDLCMQRFPLTLPGAPGSFNAWEWWLGGSAVLTGSGAMANYDVTSSGSYQWMLDNGLCALSSEPLNVTGINCGPCSLGLTAKLDCDTVFPNTYFISVTFNNPYPGSTYTLGTDIGPIMPYSGTTSSAPVESLNLTFTTYDPMAGTVTVQIEYIDVHGNKCYESVKVTEPFPCPWMIMKPGPSGDSAKVIGEQPVVTRMSNSMLIFPNPASNEVTVSYDYGTQPYNVKGISVFDVLGGKVAHEVVENATGSWKINVNGWSPGIYMVRMEGDGAALQTQRVVVVPQ